MDGLDTLIDGNKTPGEKKQPVDDTGKKDSSPISKPVIASESIAPEAEQEEDDDDVEGPQVQMRRIFAMRNQIQTSRREFEKEYHERRKSLKSKMKKVKTGIKDEERSSQSNADNFQRQTQALDENMKRMADTIRKDEEETRELCAQTSQLLQRVTEVKKKVEAGVLELRASMEQEAKLRRELMEQKDVLSDDIAQLKHLLASMQDTLEDDEMVHEIEVAQLGIEGVQATNYLHQELNTMRQNEILSEMQKLLDDISNTERLTDEALVTLQEKEEDRQGLQEMADALHSKLESVECDDGDVEAIQAEFALAEEKLRMVHGSCESIKRCMEVYQLKIEAAHARIKELEDEDKAHQDPLISATPRQSAQMHGALVGATHHSTAACLHPEMGEICATVASSIAYDGKHDSENMGLDLAAEPSCVPEHFTNESALALPPLPSATQAPTEEWMERRTAALSAAKRPVLDHTVLTMSPSVHQHSASELSSQSANAAMEKLDDAKSSLESMESLQQELEDWKEVLKSKIVRMEQNGEEEEDIATMRNELDTVEEKLALHVIDVEKVTKDIMQIESDM